MKKVKVISIVLGSLLIVLLTVVACKKGVTTDAKSEIASRLPISKVSTIQVGINSSLKGKIQSIFGKMKRPKQSKVRTQGTQTNTFAIAINQELVDLNFPMYVSYEATDITAVLFDQGNGTAFVCFTQNGLVGDMAAFITTESISSSMTRSYYYNLDYQLVGQFDYENETFLNIYTFAPTPINATNGWFSRWTGCLTQNMNDMVYKKPLAGVACIIFGPSCGAGLLTGCAAAATFN